MEMTTSGGCTTIVVQHRDRWMGLVPGALGLHEPFQVMDVAACAI
jgi:hypothetical protein